MGQLAFTVEKLATKLGVAFKGDGNCEVSSVAPLTSAQPGQVSFLENPRYRKFLSETKASLVILRAKDAEQCPTNALISDNPYLTYAKLVELLYPSPRRQAGIHPSAVVGDNTVVDPSASIGPNSIIGANCHIGKEASLGAGVILGDDCHIGAHTCLNARVTLYNKIRLGEHCVIHSGVVLGADGFGFAQSDSGWHKVPQMGGVKIGNHVEIGANTTVDCGAICDTVIEDGVKLDNQIQVGHNVHIGTNTIIAGCTAIAGSTTIGKHCMIGGGACLVGHIEIADHVVIAGMAGISKSLYEPGVYIAGIQASKHEKWRKNAVQFNHLDEIAQRLKKVEQKITEQEIE